MNCIPCWSEDHSAVSARNANRRFPEVVIIWFRQPLSTLVSLLGTASLFSCPYHLIHNLNLLEEIYTTTAGPILSTGITDR